MTRREQEILAWIRDNPLISQQELAQRAGITRSSVAVHISNLMRKGLIRGRGYLLGEGAYVAVVGAVNVDIGGTPDSALVPADSNPGRVTVTLGGVGRNIAENPVPPWQTGADGDRHGRGCPCPADSAQLPRAGHRSEPQPDRTQRAYFHLSVSQRRRWRDRGRGERHGHLRRADPCLSVHAAGGADGRRWWCWMPICRPKACPFWLKPETAPVCRPGLGEKGGPPASHSRAPDGHEAQPARSQPADRRGHP
mgnify:CR=1 FL=1